MKKVTIELSSDTLEKIVRDELNACLASCEVQYTHDEDIQYYVDLKDALKVVIKHYSVPE